MRWASRSDRTVLPIPDAVRSLWHYTYAAYKFHAGLTNADGNHHPWESKPWTWPMSLRPVLYAIDNQNVPGCGAQSCVKAVMLVGTPAMWFIAVPVLAWAVWRAFVKRDWRYAAILVGYGAGFLPWFADIDRQMYFFYAATMAPFLVMAIAMILRRHPVQAEPELRAKNARAGRGVLLCRACHYELRVDVSDPDGPTDLAVDVEHADLAAVLAVGFPSRDVHQGRSLRVIHSPGVHLAVGAQSCQPSRPASGAWKEHSSAANYSSGGLTRGQLRWRYKAVHPGIYVPRGASPSVQRDAHAAWLWTDRRGSRRRRAAAALHGAQWVNPERRST